MFVNNSYSPYVALLSKTAYFIFDISFKTKRGVVSYELLNILATNSLLIVTVSHDSVID